MPFAFHGSAENVFLPPLHTENDWAYLDVYSLMWMGLGVLSLLASLSVCLEESVLFCLRKDARSRGTLETSDPPLPLIWIGPVRKTGSCIGTRAGQPSAYAPPGTLKRASVSVCTLKLCGTFFLIVGARIHIPHAFLLSVYAPFFVGFLLTDLRRPRGWRLVFDFWLS